MVESRTPEYRKAYYEANKEKWQRYNFANLSEEQKQARLDYQREHRQKNKAKITERSRLKRQKRLEEAIKLLGGKCQRCGGVFDPIVYDFHHVDPSTKEFTIGENMLVSKIRFFAEVKKCMLLCANCHRLEHKKEVDDYKSV